MADIHMNIKKPKSQWDSAPNNQEKPLEKRKALRR
jgi:hypothetical protein